MTGTNNLASNVCLELLQVYNYLNLDKTGTNNLANNVKQTFYIHIISHLKMSIE